MHLNSVGHLCMREHIVLDYEKVHPPFTMLSTLRCCILQILLKLTLRQETHSRLLLLLLLLLFIDDPRYIQRKLTIYYNSF